MIDTTTIEFDLTTVMNESECETFADFVLMLTKKDNDERAAIFTAMILGHAECSHTSMADVMNVNSSVFHTFVMQAPDGNSKTQYINECVDILQTLRPVTDKTEH